MEIGHLDKIQNDEINEKIKFKSSEVREGQILLDLEKKAKIINSLSKLISEVENARAPFEAISDFLYDICRNEPETYRGFQEYYALIREYGQLKEKSEHDLGLKEKAESILEKINALRSDSNIEFFEALSDGVAVLKNKYDGIKGMDKGDETVKNLLEKTLFPEGENKLERDSIKYIKVSAFGIDVTVEKDYFKILIKKDEGDEKKNTKAFHQPGSFFSIYSYGEEKDMEDSRRHERVHNILEGFFPPLIAYPSFFIKNGFSLLDEYGDIEQIKQTILSFSPSECVNMLHEEMFANIERIEENLFSDPPISFIGKERRKGFGTAGNEIYLITNFLKKRLVEECDEEIRKFCAEFSEKIDEKFDEAASIMRRVLFIGNELKLEFMVHSLLAMIKPTKFHHIETYLKSQCGKERYTEYLLIYGLLFEETITLEELKSLLETKEGIPDHLKKRLREKILKNKDEFELSFTLNEDYKKEPENFLSVIEEFYLFLDIELRNDSK